VRSPLPPVTHPHHQELIAQLQPLPEGELSGLAARARATLEAHDALARQAHAAGGSGDSTCRVLTASADLLVTGLLDALRSRLPGGVAVGLVALGGYGRRELSPKSDLDLLLLHPPDLEEARLGPFAAAFSTALWDLKRSVSLSVRSPTGALDAAAADHVLATALLDARHLAGDPALLAELLEARRQVQRPSVSDAFIDAKVQELEARRRRYGGSLYVLEPHLKQGEGGLRDLDVLRWLGQQRYRAPTVPALLRQSILSPGEAAQLEAARDLLLRARHELHWQRGRKDDRLTFDSQEEVALALGYRGDAETLPVEQFMRHVYLAAWTIRRAADDMVSRCLSSRAPRVEGEAVRRLGDFRVRRGRILRGKGTPTFEEAPWRMLELFRLAEAERLGLDPHTKQELVAAVPALEAFREDPRVAHAFQVLLTRPGTRGELLFELHELGLLGAVLPEFGRILAQHQHDAYHVYTTDVHSLFALQRLQALRAGDFQDQVPSLWRRMRALDDPMPLYLAMLYHDVGKGRGGGHAEHGAEDVVRAAGRLGLNPRQTSLARFLVREHLLMSHTSQRRDLSDPQLIADFARTCGDPEQLSCLYLLTWADISAVGPNMWTSWRAQLLETLFERARDVLSGGGDAPAASSARSLCLAAWEPLLGPERAAALADSLPTRYFHATPHPAQARLDARLLERARHAPVAGALLQAADGSRLVLATRDREGLLALIAGVLTAHRIDVLSARIVTTQDGLALDSFEVRAATGGRLSRSRWREARRSLREVLEGREHPAELLAARSGRRRFAKALPPVETLVTVDNRASRRFSVVDLRAEDRPGLLYDAARLLSQLGLTIAVARINTEANAAKDSFYVTRGGDKLSPEAVEEVVRGLTRGLSADPDALPGGASLPSA